jgi:predicted dehydrogenase
MAFVEAIRGNRPVAVTGREGREALAVALAVIAESQPAAEVPKPDGR